MPEEVELLGGELVVRRVDGEADFARHAYQVVLPFRHLFAVPTYHSVVVDGEEFVRNHETLADAHYIAVSATSGAGAIRVVEAEKVGVGLLEGDSVGLEAVAEMECLRVAALGAFGPHGTAATSFEEGCLHRLGDAGHLVVVAMVGLDAVDKQCHLLLVAGRGQEIVNPHDSPPSHRCA